MEASLYEPINVYKPVAPNIGIVDGPFEYLTAGGVQMPLPFTTRMTVVRLSNGELFLHSPIKFDAGLADELLGLGTVRHLVSPNQFHYAHIGERPKAFPSAVTWASPRVRQRASARHVDVAFTRDLEARPPEEWNREIDQTLFPGGYFKEFIFFHRTSKSLILADTIFNLELDKVAEPWRTATKLTGMYHPYGQIFFGMRVPLRLQRQKAVATVKKTTPGSRSVFCLVTADVSMPMPTRSSVGYSESRPVESGLSARGCPQRRWPSVTVSRIRFSAKRRTESERKFECYSGTQFIYRPAVYLRIPKCHVEGQFVAHLPDGSDQGGVCLRLVEDGV